jgi:hypothetical protein
MMDLISQKKLLKPLEEKIEDTIDENWDPEEEKVEEKIIEGSQLIKEEGGNQNDEDWTENVENETKKIETSQVDMKSSIFDLSESFHKSVSLTKEEEDINDTITKDDIKNIKSNILELHDPYFLMPNVEKEIVFKRETPLPYKKIE